MKISSFLWKSFLSLVIFALILGLGAPAAPARAALAEVSAAQNVKGDPSYWPLQDLRVRQAVAYCTDKVALVKAGYPLMTDEQAQTLVMNSFIPSWSPFYAGDTNLTIYGFNPDAGKALLEAAGWTVGENGFRFNAAGEELALKLTTSNASFRQAWAAVWEQQLGYCGIRLLRNAFPGDWWFGSVTGLARRDFEIAGFAWVGQADPGGYSLFSCNQIPTAANNWDGQNYMGWCNPTADLNINLAVNSLDDATRKAAYKVVQQEYTADVPAIPLFNRSETYSINANLQGFNPQPGDYYYTYNIQDWQIPGNNEIWIGTSQEPASLYTLLDTSMSAALAYSLVNPPAYYSLNYTYTPNLVTQLSTFENGLAANKDVLVNIGDVALDANGNVGPVSTGTLVIDASGNQVAMDASGVTMKQIVATYTWRNDLVWSDGVPLTVEDFQLGYQATCDPANGAPSYSFYTCDRTQEVQFATSTNTYMVTYVPGYQDPTYFLAPYRYYPAHQVITSSIPFYGFQLKDIPPSEWNTLNEITNLPLGVGPYQIVEWWHGDRLIFTANPFAPDDLAPVTPTVYIKWFATPSELESHVINGIIDVLDPINLAGLTQNLVDAETAGKVKNFVVPGATWEHADFNLEYVPDTIKPTADPNVRKAIAYCTNKVDLLKAGYYGISDAQAQNLVMNSFISKESPFYAGDSALTLYEFNPDAGRALLEASGWTVGENGYRFNAQGEELALKITTTTTNIRQTWTQLFAEQMAECGIRVLRQHYSSNWWFGTAIGLARRDFELGEFAWVGQTDPGAETLFACDQIPGALNGWYGQNDAGWCNPTASQALIRANHTLERAQRVVDYMTVQQEYTADLPTLPLFNRAKFFSAVSNLVGFAPTPGEDFYVYNVQNWQIPGKSKIVLGVGSEPASLYTLIGYQGFGGDLANYLINPRSYLSLNYEPTPRLTLQNSTVENGLALNNPVPVNIGDKAVDANGHVTTMADGMLVYDSMGNKVPMTSSGVYMNQLVVTYKWRNDLKWSDGVALTIDDFKLGKQVACDPATGAQDYSMCDRTVNVQFATNGTNTYTVTYVPGYQNPLYYLAPYGYYPAHQIITTSGPYTGYMLKNVPHANWSSLLEITDKPLGVGPYVLSNWIKGDKMVFSANPYAPSDLAPKTANLEIKFIDPANVEVALLGGTVDVLGSDSLYGLSDALLTAESYGNVKNYVLPDATWEHIDFHLDPLPVASQVDPGSAAQIVVSDPQNNQTTVDIPSGAATSTVTVELVQQTAPAQQDNAYQFAGSAFSLTASEGGVPLETYTFAQPVTVTLEYSDSDLAGMVEANLALYYWDVPTSSWLDAADTCTGLDYLKGLDMVNNILTVHICHLSEFATFAPPKAVTLTSLAATISPTNAAHLVAMVGIPVGKVPPPVTVDGQVVFMDGTKELGTVNLVAGTAALDVTLSPGWHLLLAHYLGSDTYAESVSSGAEAQGMILLYLPMVKR